MGCLLTIIGIILFMSGCDRCGSGDGDVGLILLALGTLCIYFSRRD